MIRILRGKQRLIRGLWVRSKIVDDYQKNGADGYPLADTPKSLNRAYEQLYEVQQQIEKLKPKKTYDPYAPWKITDEQYTWGSP